MRRAGFTIVELLVALVILGIVLLSLGRFVGTYIHESSISRVRITATAVAQGRLELVRADPRYTELKARYGTGAGAQPGADTTGFFGYPRMRRVTMIDRDTRGNPARDYTTITVTVTDPSMRDTVALTSLVARP